MSIEAITRVLHHSQASGTTKLVLVGIANHCGPGGAYPSVATLMKYAGLSERRVQKAIGDLKLLGELEVATNRGGKKVADNGRRPNLYTVLLECPPGCDGTTNHRMQEVETGAAECTPGAQDPVTPGVTPAAPKPSSEPSVQTSSYASARAAAATPPTEPPPMRLPKQRTSPSQTQQQQREEDHPWYAYLRDAIPNRFSKSINRKTLNSLAANLQANGWTAASIHLAIRGEDWESANTAGAIVEWLRGAEPPKGKPGCAWCKGHGYYSEAYYEGGPLVVQQCDECAPDETHEFHVKGVEYAYVPPPKSTVSDPWAS